MYIKTHDYDDDNYDEMFLRYAWPRKGVYPLFPVGTIVRDSHQCQSPSHHEQDLNLRRIRVQTLSSCAVVITTTSSCAVVITTTSRRHASKTLGD